MAATLASVSFCRRILLPRLSTEQLRSCFGLSFYCNWNPLVRLFNGIEYFMFADDIDQGAVKRSNGSLTNIGQVYLVSLNM